MNDFDRMLIERHSTIAWLEPSTVIDPAGKERFGCRLCIARYGLKGSEVEKSTYCFVDRADHTKHMKDRHQ